jgi:antirestriction protein ArdC
MFKTDKFREALLTNLDKLTDNWQTVYSFKDYSSAFNIATGNEYNGVNSLLLTFLGLNDGFKEINGWATFEQIKALKGRIKKDSKGIPIRCKPINIQVKDKNGNVVLDEEGNPKTYPYYKPATVFSVDNMVDVDLTKFSNEKNKIEHSDEDIAIYNKVVEQAKKKGIEIVSEKQDIAYYKPDENKVNVPDIQWLRDNGYATLLHELIHATGHETRLKRKKGNTFGSDDYAYEELIAEIGSIVSCQHLRQDFKFDKNSIAYIKGWLNKCHKNNKDDLIINAINQALDAVKWLFDDFKFI